VTSVGHSHVFILLYALMRILFVDALNTFMHRFPGLWSRSFDVVAAELRTFEEACRAAGYFPYIVVDLYRLCQVGHQKWKRRQRKLWQRNRAVPCSAGCMIGTILAETDLLWTYATNVEADDLIIDLASKQVGSTVLSGDKGFLRVPSRTFCVARSCSYSEGQLHLQIEHVYNCRCDADGEIPNYKIKHNFAKLCFYSEELKRKQHMTKGVFYSAFDTLPCIWCFLTPLRQHMYAKANIDCVREVHVCGTLSRKNQSLTWDTTFISKLEFEGDFIRLCNLYVKRYEDLTKSYTVHLSTDLPNAVFACATACAQILTDIWFIESSKFDMKDDVVPGGMFKKYLAAVQKRLAAK
jgi:hypothetical protein